MGTAMGTMPKSGFLANSQTKVATNQVARRSGRIIGV